MAVVATLTPTPIPSSDSLGGFPGDAMVFHGTITAAGGAGSYLVNHGLPYKPTFAMVIPVLADGVTPTAANAAVGRVSADDTASAFGVALPGNGTYEVIYG